MQDFSSSQTIFDFVLPKGLLDSQGNLHRKGKIRLATARDETMAAKDPRVQENPAYATLVRLSRTIARLGDRSHLEPQELENLFTVDLAYLCELYNQVNQKGHPHATVQCPHCQKDVRVDLSNAGEPLATP
ncbi:hypothetical protein [Baaleninema simplex]|uniref:hypothetical protein n=1 Tax=Baaleninema simplex TaxID=2862350 RepID=UPI00034DEDF3|nr:hypothetical protein [Baaleninema simplex]